MKTKTLMCGLVACAAALVAPVQFGRAQQDNALLDALVKKGVLSDQEREDIVADEQKEYSQSAASKITLSPAIKNITFYGDLRLRYEMRDGSVHAGDLGNAGNVFGHDDSQTRSRWRYRLRFGVKGEMYDNFFWGLRLSTGQKYDRSGNVTFGDTQNGGEFGNAQSLLNIDRVYLGWKPTDYLTLVGGKMENPFYTTNLVWDDNLSPTGAAESFEKKFGGVSVFATAGQFIYGDSADNGFNLSGGTNYDDIFMFGEQVGFKVSFDENTFFKMAASIYTYSGTQNGNANGTVAGDYPSGMFNFAAPNNSPSYFDGPYVGAASAPSTNVSGINDLAVLEVPMEFDFKLGRVPMRIFGDFAYNFEADARADQARQAINAFAATGASNEGVTAPTPLAGQTQADANAAFLGSRTVQGVLSSGKGFLDQAAYQVGIEAGQTKKKGDWDAKLVWQSTGYYAVDPNLIDADIFNAAPNLQGVVVSVAHNWTDGLTSTLRYAHATPVNGQLSTPNVNQDLQVSTIHDYNLFQADLMWKF